MEPPTPSPSGAATLTPADGNVASAGSANEVTLDVRPLARRVLIGCVIAEVALVVLDYHVNYGRSTEIGAIRRLFNSAREDGLASFFSVTQTAFVAFTLWLVAMAVRWRGAGRWRTGGWLVLAAFFAWMAIDDGSKVHERVGTAAEILASRSSPEGSLLGAFPSYAWQVVFLPFFGALGLFMLVFLWWELKDTLGRTLLVAGIGLFVLAVGMDFCEGLDRKHPWNPYQWIAQHPGVGEFTMARFRRPAYEASVHFSKSIEEFAEMFGTTLLWTAVLRHWAHLVGNLRVRIHG